MDSVANTTIYRNGPGTNCEVSHWKCINNCVLFIQEWNRWNKLAFDEMEGTFNVQQWIQQCIKYDAKDVDAILECPAGVDEGVWKYEHLRQFCAQLNGLTVLLQVFGSA